MGRQLNKTKKHSRKWACIFARKRRETASANHSGGCPAVQSATFQISDDRDFRSCDNIDEFTLKNDVDKANSNTSTNVIFSSAELQQFGESIPRTVSSIFEASDSQTGQDSYKLHEEVLNSQVNQNRSHVESILLAEQLISDISDVSINRDMHALDNLNCVKSQVVATENDAEAILPVKPRSDTSDKNVSQGSHELDQNTVNTLDNNNTSDFVDTKALHANSDKKERLLEVSTNGAISEPNIAVTVNDSKEKTFFPELCTDYNGSKLENSDDLLSDYHRKIPLKNYGKLFQRSKRKYIPRVSTASQTSATKSSIALSDDTFDHTTQQDESSCTHNISLVDQLINNINANLTLLDEEANWQECFAREIESNSDDDNARVSKHSEIPVDSSDEKVHIHTDYVRSNISDNVSECSDLHPTQESQFKNDKETEFIDPNGRTAEERDFSDIKVDGRRITDINYLFQELHAKFDEHKHCHGRLKDLCIYKAADKGMRTLLGFICLKCKYKANVWTDSLTPKEKLPILEGLMFSSLTSGTGFSTVEEALAGVGIPFVSAKTYRDNRAKITPDIKKLLEKELKEAGNKERELAIAQGRLIDGKYPWTIVIGDGVWSKRSYVNGRYDALSGAAVLVSAFTGLILFIGIRNKYCTICLLYESRGMKPPPHKPCEKNWGINQASTAMEADIISEGFTSSWDTHKIIYKIYIGDGDSSVHDKIVSNDPYAEYDVRVEKVECSLHLFRRYSIAMATASKKTVNNTLPRGAITKVRQQIRRSVLPTIDYIRTRVIYYQDQEISEKEKVSKLVTDITNMIGHFFGNHSLCGTSFDDCNRFEEDLTTYLQQVGLYADIETAVDRLAKHAASLLKQKSTNPAEWYNSIHNKTLGGRRINFSKREGYLLKAYLAAVQYNSQEALSRYYQFKGIPVPSAVSTMEASRKAQNVRTALYRQRKGRKRIYKKGMDKNYGVNCAKPDISKEIYDQMEKKLWQKLSQRQQNRDNIQKETINQYASEQWREYRRIMITASKFGQICRMKETTSCHNIVCSIRYPKNVNTSATQYGKTHEPDVIKDLAAILGKEIQPSGLFIDEKIPYLGATPDGLIEENGIVEVKCLPRADHCTPQEAIATIPLYARIFDKKDQNSMNQTHYYFYQVQGQLHITQRQYCIFAVWTPHGTKHVKVFRDDKFWENHMEEKLKRFYMNCLLPEIIDGRKNRGKRVQDPQYILDAQEKLKSKKLDQIKRKNREKDNGQPHSKYKKKESPEEDEQDNKMIPPIFDFEEDFCQKTDETVSSNDENTNNKKNDGQWVIISDDDADDREAPDWELEALNIVIHSITDSEVINEIASLTTLLSSAAVDQFLKIIQSNSKFHVHFAHYFAFRHLVTSSTTDRDLHIIGGNTYRHWCCLCYIESQLFVYDSSGRMEYEQLKTEEKKYIKKRYPHVEQDDIIFQPVTMQPDGQSCGVYAAAFATTLALNNDPALVSQRNYSRDANVMREHMVSIIRHKTLVEFPIV